MPTGAVTGGVVVVRGGLRRSTPPLGQRVEEGGEQIGGAGGAPASGGHFVGHPGDRAGQPVNGRCPLLRRQIEHLDQESGVPMPDARRVEPHP
jgi:hypothetical protein